MWTGSLLLQLAHHEEKLMLLEQSLAATQEQLSQRVSEVVKYEQLGRKLNTELKTMTERNLADEEEIAEAKVGINYSFILAFTRVLYLIYL